MAVKTVEFLRIDLKRNDGGHEKHSKLKDIFESIFKSKCVNNGKYRSLDLSPNIKPDDVEPKKILDLFTSEPYFFGRISKKKSRNTIMKRDYETLKADEVFNSQETLKQGIEVFTFFLLDYEKGILAIANAKDAPGVLVLNNILEYYCPNYEMEFTGIPNEDGINILWDSPSPELSKIEFELAVPNIEYLTKVLELDESVVMQMVADKNFKAQIVITAGPYKKLERDQGVIRRVIEDLKRRRYNYDRLIVTGKSDEFNTRNFDLHAKFFTYPIDIRNFRTVKRKKVEYTLEEITEQFEDKLQEVYYTINYHMILALADRMD